MSVSKSATRRVGEGSLRSFTGPHGGSLLPPEAAAFALAGALLCPAVLCPAADGFAAGTGLLLPEAAAFTHPRAFFASRIGSAILTTAGVSALRLDGPSPSLSIQQQQYSVRKEKPSSHEPCET
jgi:hypothetical protein